MADTTKNLDLTIDRQIRLLSDLRDDLRVLLNAHPSGVWFQMLPKAFHMHFNRDLQLGLLDIQDPLSVLDYISDIVKFDLPENGNDNDFIIELIPNSSKVTSGSMRSMDLHKIRDTLLNKLRDVNTGGRGSFLREICAIDEQLSQIKDEPQSSTNSSPPPPLPLLPTTPPPPTREQVAVRLQKIRSMIDVCLRHLFKTPEQISDGELTALYDQCERFIVNLTPFAQQFSSTPSSSPSQ